MAKKLSETKMTEVRVREGFHGDGFDVSTTGNGYQYWNLFTCGSKAKAMRLANMVGVEFKTTVVYESRETQMEELRRLQKS